MLNRYYVPIHIVDSPYPNLQNFDYDKLELLQIELSFQKLLTIIFDKVKIILQYGE